MKSFILLLLLSTTSSLIGQVNLPERKIQVTLGSSLHATGDISGMAFATEYEKYFRKKTSWTIALGGTIHDGYFPIFFNNPSGQTIDGSFRYTTAGFQVTNYLGYDFIRTPKHELQGKIGGLLRYQSSSYFDELGIFYPLATGLPIPVLSINNTTPQKTYAVGASCQLHYNYTFSNNICIGLLGGFQIDSNGDNISMQALTLGKRF